MLTFEISRQYKGFGISNGLDRGLLVYQNGILLLDEGMGLGALSVQLEGINYFASILKVKSLQDRIEVTLSIDKMLQRTIFGISSKSLTRFVEKTCTNMYKDREKTQGFWFKVVGLINMLLQIKADFVKVPSIGQFVLNYKISPEKILVDLSGELENAADKIFVMNELSGSLFNMGTNAGKAALPPTGWQRAKSEIQLKCDIHKLSFTTTVLSKPEDLESQRYWGRESDKEHCWAGFIYQLRTKAKGFQHFKYAVLFQEGD